MHDIINTLVVNDGQVEVALRCCRPWRHNEPMATEATSPPAESQVSHRRILHALGRDIVDGRLAPGERILTGDVAETFGASRSAMREVVRVLESMGLVEVRRRAGVEILPRDRWNVYDPELIRWQLDGPDRLRVLHELSQLRSTVEPLAARLAATEASPAQTAVLVGEVMGMVAHAHEATSDVYLAHDVAFHTVILRASGNPYLAGLTDVVAEVLRGRTSHSLMPAAADPDALRLHQDVAALISQHRPEEAAAAMAAIVTEADRAVGEIAAASPEPAVDGPGAAQRSG